MTTMTMTKKQININIPAADGVITRSFYCDIDFFNTINKVARSQNRTRHNFLIFLLSGYARGNGSMADQLEKQMKAMNMKSWNEFFSFVFLEGIGRYSKGGRDDK